MVGESVSQSCCFWRAVFCEVVLLLFGCLSDFCPCDTGTRNVSSYSADMFLDHDHVFLLLIQHYFVVCPQLLLCCFKLDFPCYSYH